MRTAANRQGIFGPFLHTETVKAAEDSAIQRKLSFPLSICNHTGSL